MTWNIQVWQTCNINWKWGSGQKQCMLMDGFWVCGLCRAPLMRKPTSDQWKSSSIPTSNLIWTFELHPPFPPSALFCLLSSFMFLTGCLSREYHLCVCVWEREMLVWGMYLHQDQYSGLLKLFTFFLLKKGVCNLTFRITHSHTSWEHKLMSWWYWCLSPWLLTIGCYRYNTTRILYLCTISVGPDHRARADMKIGKITKHTTCMNSKSYNLTLWITASESFHTETWK